MPRCNGVFAHIGGPRRRRPAERPPTSIVRHHRRDQQHLPLRRARPRRISAAGRRWRHLRRQLVDLGRLRRHHRVQLLPAELLPDELRPSTSIPTKFPRGDNCSMTFASMHPGGANFAFCDGSVRFIKNSINSGTLRRSRTQQGELYPQRAAAPACTRPSRPATAARSSAATASDRSPPGPSESRPPDAATQRRPRGDTFSIPSGKRPHRPRSSPGRAGLRRAAGDPADLAVRRSPCGGGDDEELLEKAVVV